MAWRFKASKYKNAAPIVPKPETYVRDICVGSYQTYGNTITASAKFMAFNWDHAGSSLAVLPIDDCGRKSKLMPLLHAHSDTVTDMQFSPFHDGLLATGSQDCLVKIWHIPEAGLQESLSNSECTFSHKQRRVEGVGFHPTADFLLHSTSYTTLTLWDLISQQDFFTNSDHTDIIQSTSWKKDGSLIVTSCKDKQVRIIDPRVETSCVKSANSHQSIKDSRVVWLGDHDKILTTGFDASRLRQVIVRDLRNFSNPEKTLELDCSTGILIPLYDPDTGMLFLAGKGDTTISYMEISDKEPYLIEGLRHTGEQTKGACLVPKRALNVMQGEVNRVLQLTSGSVIPITYQVPRKTYRDFHADLYPDTTGYVSDLTAAAWFQGKNIPVAKISLDPAKRPNGEAPITVHRGPLSKLKEAMENSQNSIETQHHSKVTQPKVTSAIVKNDFVPIKAKISNLEKDNFKENSSKHKPMPSDKAKSDSAHISDNKISEYNKINSNEFSTAEKSELENGIHIVPPKPMPRTSRTGSICEVIEDSSTTPKPVARPRTNSCAPIITAVNPNLPIVGGYKPRLGPKPFTPPKLNESESFDKVFCVPPVPSGKAQNGVHENDISNSEIREDVEGTTQACEDNLHKLELSAEDENGGEAEVKTPTTAERRKLFEPKHEEEELKVEDNHEEDSSRETPRTPTTAERRKMFETRNDSKENDPEDNFDGNDLGGNFERASAQRTSIAERRKMYENRSLSVKETNSDKMAASPILLRRKGSFKNQKDDESEENRKNSQIVKQQSLDPQMGKKVEPLAVPAPTPKRTSTVFGRVSKFRLLKGTPAHKSQHIENIRNVSRQIPGECDGFQANPERVAVPLSGPGGKIAIFELSKRGKLPDGVIPALVHGSNVMDFYWDPFDNSRLAVACDDGMIKLWRIAESGLSEPINTPEEEFSAHSDKIYFIKFHPLAQNVLASGSYDMTVRIWNLSNTSENIVLEGHTEHIFSFAWSPCGVYCATVSKDGKIRIYNPRKGTSPIYTGKGPVGSRGARVVWALEGSCIVVTGFDKVSERQIMVYKANDLSAPLNTVGLDVSPAILMPFYDEDSSTLFLTGKGDSTIYAYEVTEEAPYICPLSHHRCSTLHQGLSFLPKNECDVSNVEFAKALRLTNNTIEPLSFTVPRIKMELFQDDLFPPTIVTWKPTLSSSEWFAGRNKEPLRVSLKPEGMDLLSDVQASASDKTNKSSESFTAPAIGRLGWGPDLTGQVKTKQDEIQKSVSSRLEVNMTLEQDNMEGVDEKEWDE
ncbi:coronin-7 isoform X1 [Photinus pyralis]|nr:coronin-7 isoform X1 [Photinus pyralis]